MPSNFRELGELATSWNEFAAALGSDGAKHIAKEMGDEAQRQAERAASADLGGDPMMSGWPVARLDTTVKLLEPGSLVLTPASRPAAGGWTTATVGRNHGHSGFAGPGVNNRTGATTRTKAGGLRKVRQFTGSKKRYNGVTAGKGTADDARALIAAEMPKVVERELPKLIRRFLK